MNIPLSLGPLDDDEYIEDITQDFREENHREPYGAAELLHWHRRRINNILREFGCEITADLEVANIGTEGARRE
jgi:hypothetical protein